MANQPSVTNVALRVKYRPSLEKTLDELLPSAQVYPTLLNGTRYIPVVTATPEAEEFPAKTSRAVHKIIRRGHHQNLPPNQHNSWCRDAIISHEDKLPLIVNDIDLRIYFDGSPFMSHAALVKEKYDDSLNNASHFAKLDKSLRFKIYDLVQASTDYSKPTRNWVAKFGPAASVPMLNALRRTCRLLYDEITRDVYARAIFHLSSPSRLCGLAWSLAQFPSLSIDQPLTLGALVLDLTRDNYFLACFSEDSELYKTKKINNGTAFIRSKASLFDIKDLQKVQQVKLGPTAKVYKDRTLCSWFDADRFRRERGSPVERSETQEILEEWAQATNALLLRQFVEKLVVAPDPDWKTAIALSSPLFEMLSSFGDNGRVEEVICVSKNLPANGQKIQHLLQNALTKSDPAPKNGQGTKRKREIFKSGPVKKRMKIDNSIPRRFFSPPATDEVRPFSASHPVLFVVPVSAPVRFTLNHKMITLNSYCGNELSRCVDAFIQKYCASRRTEVDQVVSFILKDIEGGKCFGRRNTSWKGKFYAGIYDFELDMGPITSAEPLLIDRLDIKWEAWEGQSLTKPLFAEFFSANQIPGQAQFIPMLESYWLSLPFRPESRSSWPEVQVYYAIMEFRLRVAAMHARMGIDDYETFSEFLCGPLGPEDFEWFEDSWDVEGRARFRAHIEKEWFEKL